MDRMKLLLLMDKLEELVKRSPVVPLTGRVVVGLAPMEDLLSRLREAIPEEAGMRVSAESAREPDEPASRQRRAGERRSPAGLPGDKPAVTDSERRAEEIRRGADRYADDVLERLERSLHDALGVVRRGRDELKRTSADRDEGEGPSGPSPRAAAAVAPGGAENETGGEAEAGDAPA